MNKKNKLSKWIVIAGGGVIIIGFFLFHIFTSPAKVTPKWKITPHKEKKDTFSNQGRRPLSSIQRKGLVKVIISSGFSIPKEINLSTNQELKFINQTKTKLILKDKENYLSKMTLKPGESKIISFHEPLQLTYTISSPSSNKVHSGIIKVN